MPATQRLLAGNWHVPPSGYEVSEQQGKEVLRPQDPVASCRAVQCHSVMQTTSTGPSALVNPMLKRHRAENLPSPSIRCPRACTLSPRVRMQVCTQHADYAGRYEDAYCSATGMSLWAGLCSPIFAMPSAVSDTDADQWRC